jgi:hypothetical protein
VAAGIPPGTARRRDPVVAVLDAPQRGRDPRGTRHHATCASARRHERHPRTGVGGRRRLHRPHPGVARATSMQKPRPSKAPWKRHRLPRVARVHKLSLRSVRMTSVGHLHPAPVVHQPASGTVPSPSAGHSAAGAGRAHASSSSFARPLTGLVSASCRQIRCPRAVRARRPRGRARALRSAWSRRSRGPTRLQRL